MHLLLPFFHTFLNTGSAGGTAGEVVEKINDKFQGPVNQVDGDWTTSTTTAQEEVEAVDQAVDEQHFLGGRFGLGESVQVLLEQCDHLRATGKLLIFHAFRVGSVSALPAAGRAAQDFFRLYMARNGSAALGAAHAAPVGLCGQKETVTARI